LRVTRWDVALGLGFALSARVARWVDNPPISIAVKGGATPRIATLQRIDYFTVEFSDSGAVTLRAAGYHVRAGSARRQLREELEVLAGELRAALGGSGRPGE
jgi:hypothetical protein